MTSLSCRAGIFPCPLTRGQKAPRVVNEAYFSHNPHVRRAEQTFVCLDPPRTPDIWLFSLLFEFCWVTCRSSRISSSSYSSFRVCMPLNPGKEERKREVKLLKTLRFVFSFSSATLTLGGESQTIFVRATEEGKMSAGLRSAQLWPPLTRGK